MLEVEIEIGVHETKNLFGKSGKNVASFRMQCLIIMEWNNGYDSLIIL